MIDFHTHHHREHKHIFSLLEIPNQLPQHFCYGAHPWYLENFNLDEFKKEIIELKNESGFFALGEIGLDRTRGVDIEKQKEIFIQILHFAQEQKIKNIVIHCVKAFSDFAQCMKKMPFSGNTIFHDYRGNLDFIKSCNLEHCYFSFGKTLLTNKRIQNLVRDLPIDRILLETDDDKSLDISELYRKLLEIKQLNLADVKKAMQANLVKLKSI